MKAIFLVGLMGSGKSSVGRQLAKRLKRRFADTDLQVAKRSGMSVARIFALKGEARFRQLETAALRSLRGASLVVATGGGAVISAENRTWMARHGVVVHLKVPLKVLKRRLHGAQGSKRPLLAALPRLARQRARYYRQAKIQVRADRPIPDVIAAILRQIQRKTPLVLADKTAR